MKFKVNPVIKADKVTALGFRFRCGEVYDSAALGIIPAKMETLLRLRMGDTPFFVSAENDHHDDAAAPPPAKKED